MMRKLLISLSLMAAFTSEAVKQPTVEWDSKSLIFDGHRVMPVMGEIHYSRLPEAEWAEEVRKMKEGGVTIIATYVFWNHVEEIEGIFNWSGQRNLRHFVEICAAEDMPVVLRLGPFCHGEVRNGGIPDWVFTKGCKTRDNNPVFMSYAKRLYRQIFTQVQGLQWKDGGPLLAVQFDNEQSNGTYLMALKKAAVEIGFDLPFYTRTGWPALTRPVPFGEMLPLFGDYADGFWDRSIKEGAGNYYKAFNFKAFRSSTAIATDQFGAQKEETAKGDNDYPYFTCELGGGMATAYHRRPFVYPEDAYALAIVKLGSGSNLLGYYMYHGGTNPEAATTLNENQRTPETNHNDMPVKTYDFQAPLGEFGQPYEHYYLLHKLHLFMHDWQETLAPMEASFPCPQDISQGDDSHLRWSYRMLGDSGFVFVNNYERLQNLKAKNGIRFKVGDLEFPNKAITIPASTSCIFPFNVDGMRYATAQPIARRDGKLYLQQIPGIPTEIALSNGKVMRNVKPRGISKPVVGNIYLLTEKETNWLFLKDTPCDEILYKAKFVKVSEATATPRKISIGARNVAEAPSDADFSSAAVYRIDFSSLPVAAFNRMLRIDYRGDVARLYANGKLVADNFYNGRPFLFGLRRLPEGCKELELRILPMQADMPVYFPKEADRTPGESAMVTIE